MAKIHPLAAVQSSDIGENTMIWQFCVVLKQAKIGDNCNINCHVFIENNVTIGNNVTVKPGVQIWDGITLENDVFIGPNVTFTNDHFPKSKNNDFTLRNTLIKTGCSIGANATILGGLTLGENSLIGAGSVVTKDVPANEIWVGNPAKFLKNIHD